MVLGDDPAPAQPTSAGKADAVAAAEQGLEVVVVPPQPTPAPRATDRLAVLPPPTAPLATPPRQTEPPAAKPLAREASAFRPPIPSAPPDVMQASQDANARAPVQARDPDPCGDAPTRAYAMVCRDARLASADLRMKRAYAAALAAGVPRDELRRDQEDWLEVREEASEVSRRAVADLYRQRIRRLNDLADEFWE